MYYTGTNDHNLKLSRTTKSGLLLPVVGPLDHQTYDKLKCWKRQRSITRNINGMKGLDYAQRLNKPKIYSMQRQEIKKNYKKEKLGSDVIQSHGL